MQAGSQKSKKDLVSIIIPTYNVEKYLEQCLDSIIAQEYDNFEAIVVIDGCKDNSKYIAEEYARKDGRFSVIVQENAGSGPARNNGIKHSKGSYFMFVDPDDWIEEHLLKNLVDAQEGKFDFVVSGATSVIFDGDKEKKRLINIPYAADYDYYEMRRKYLSLFEQGLLCSPTKKLYKRSIIEENSIEFPDLRRSQDIVFNYRYIDKCNNLRVVPYSGYFYRIEPKVRIAKLKKDYYKTINLIVEEVIGLYKKWDIKVSAQEIADTYIYMYVAAIEANIMAGKDFHNIISSNTANFIFQHASCKRIDLKLIKYCVQKDYTYTLRMVVRLRMKIKRLCNKQ